MFFTLNENVEFMAFSGPQYFNFQVLLVFKLH